MNAFDVRLLLRLDAQRIVLNTDSTMPQRLATGVIVRV